MMKSRRWIALAGAALIGAVLVAPAFGGSETQDGNRFNNIIYRDGVPYRTESVLVPILIGGVRRSDTTSVAATFDANGNLLVTESAPATTFLVKHQSIVQATLFRTGAYQAAPTTATFANPQADSSSAVSMIGCNRMALGIAYTLDDSTSSALLCVSVRGHISASADSVSTFPWLGYAPHVLTNSVSIRDTLGAILADGGLGNGGISVQTDTLNVHQEERPIWLSKTEPGDKRYIWMPIMNDRAEWFAAPYVSVRVRIIQMFGANGAKLTGKASPRIPINIDLVGWR